MNIHNDYKSNLVTKTNSELFKSQNLNLQLQNNLI